jgi:alpha-beta hydrolase superfamily lysophospholipase
VARHLVDRGIGTFLLDLLTLGEEQIDAVTRHLRFNIPFLGKRLVEATRWISDQQEARDLSLGYFGASTGSAAALVAAAGMKHSISAVVSRGGRPDLAGHALSLVTAPTLLLVGAKDTEVEQLNRQAMLQMHCEKKLVIIPGATHLFEEPGTLDQVAVDAADWFARYFNHHGNPGLKPAGSGRKGGQR